MHTKWCHSSQWIIFSINSQAFLYVFLPHYLMHLLDAQFFKIFHFFKNLIFSDLFRASELPISAHLKSVASIDLDGWSCEKFQCISVHFSAISLQSLTFFWKNVRFFFFTVTYLFSKSKAQIIRSFNPSLPASSLGLPVFLFSINSIRKFVRS